MTIYHVGLMAGGRGTRLWPLSRRSHLKQSLKFFSGKSLLDKTISRFGNAKSIHLVCTKELKNSLERDGKLKVKYLLEPRPANTAAAVAFYIYSLKEKKISLNDPVILSGTDYFIADEKEFKKTLQEALKISKKTDGIILLGVNPNGVPSTEYGYLLKDSKETFSKLKGFQEKPDFENAKKLLEQDALWNSGMFMGRLGCFIEAIESCDSSLKPPGKKAESLYKRCKERNFDKAVLEHWNKVYALDLNCGWDDVGSWDRIFQLAKSSEFNGVAGNSLVYNLSSKKVVLNTDQSLVVVVDDDMIYVMDKDKSEQSKKILSSLEAEGKIEFT